MKADWQPIETAAREEATAILGYFGSGRYGTMHWTGWGGGSWRCAFTGHNISSEPTHWIPLPDPPDTGDD